jgi:wyosine [tRNA(Phe)-imidazoG37] synthetase (radical SAM superfamily)
MLLAGVTGMVAEVERLAEVAARIAPDRIQLNTAVRPPAESFVAPVPAGSMQELTGLFTPHAEVIADTVPADGDRVARHADILALLSRRPCTVADIAAGLGIHHSEALKAATALVTEGALELHTHEDRSFYVAAPATAENREEERS